ncbi:PD-(D/E)XK motif protein [Corynebacterium sanguinis]
MIPATHRFGFLKTRILEGEFGSSQGISEETEVINQGGRLKLFVDSSGAQGLWVPFGSEDGQLSPDTKSRFITLRSVTQEGREYAELRLLEPSLESVLFTFVDAYLKLLATSAENAVTKLAAQFHRWRSLFAPAPGKGLSGEAELGLLGELQTLQELLESDGETAFFRWTGSDSSRHDFKFDDRDIECKATTSRTGLRVKINGAAQLEPSGERPLLLIVRRYEETPNGSISLRELVSELLMHDEIPAEEFLGKLRGMDYTGVSGPDTQERRFELIDVSVFEVVDQFPRLKAASIPQRVVHCVYTIDLTSIHEVPGFRRDGSLS